MSETGTENKLSPAQIAHEVGDIILDKRGRDLVVMDISQMSTSLADYLIIGSGTNKRQVQAIADSIDHDMKQKNIRRLSVSGREYGWWVLVDLGDVVVHVMQEDARRFYDLETLWSDAPVIRRMDGASPEPAEPASPSEDSGA